MRIDTVETKIYKFNELSDEAKEKAIESLFDINVNYDWWDCTYEDASQIGIELTYFDLGRASYCTGNINDIEETANLIILNHGDICTTYETARTYLNDRSMLVQKYSDGINIDRVHEDKKHEFDCECDDLDKEFRRSILEDYRIILQKEYEHLTSKESIIETIEANEYEFTINGGMY